ncbi:MAG: hypothetical protein KatS3mg011_0419 [Acidimicrobiia bacterium]|nr:MAG: hypothetical protein KatS3mg011_0419 [Acidimicrobiia bacterium]
MAEVSSPAGAEVQNDPDPWVGYSPASSGRAARREIRAELQGRQHLGEARPEQVGASRRPDQEGTAGEHRLGDPVDHGQIGDVLGGVARGVEGAQGQPLADLDVFQMEGGTKSVFDTGAGR